MNRQRRGTWPSQNEQSQQQGGHPGNQQGGEGLGQNQDTQQEGFEDPQDLQDLGPFDDDEPKGGRQPG